MTLRDVARKAGYHYSTVSLALRNDPRINGKTREKILHVARGIDYTPDPLTRALAIYRTSLKQATYHATLAWLSNADPSLLNPKYIGRRYAQGARQRAAELGYKLEEFRLNESGTTVHNLPKILRSRGINGILVAPRHHDQRQTEIHMDWSLFPAVTFGYSLAWPLLHLVTNYHHGSVKIALRELIQLGYKRIGLIVDKVGNDRVDGNWVGGYMAEVIKQELEPLIFLRYCGNAMTLLVEQEVPKLKAWLKKTRPDALIIDYSAPFIDWLNRACGLRVPEDIGVVSLNVDSSVQSGIDQNEHEIGATAVDLLVSLIHTNERGIPAIARRVLIEGTWRLGKTVSTVRLGRELQRYRRCQ